MLPSSLLRRALLADALFSGIAAVLLTVDAGALAPLLELPETLLRETGLFLIAYTALVGWLSAKTSLPKVLVMVVIAGNAAWTAGSIALLLSGAVTPNALGEAFVVAQAMATGVFAELQYMGLRKSAGEAVAEARIHREKQAAVATALWSRDGRGLTAPWLTSDCFRCPRCWPRAAQADRVRH
jgi:hypothetical protein